MGTQTRARPLAVVTGASSGIGLELAKLCAKDGYDLVIAADDGGIEAAVQELSALGATVDAIQGDLATIEGNDRLIAALRGRPVDALLANAGHGLGGAFLDQEWAKIRSVVDTNVTGTLYLIRQIGVQMRARRQGKVLITGSIAGLQPGPFQAVYNSSKSFIDAFAIALRAELEGSGVTVTLLMPGVTDTNFFNRAELQDTRVGQSEKQPAVEVAKVGFEAMKQGEQHVVAGLKNKLQAVLAHVTPAAALAEQHRRMAEPGSGKS